MGEVKTFILINNMGGGGAERQVSYISRLTEIEKVISLEPVVYYPIDGHKLHILYARKARSVFNKAYQIIMAPYRLKKLGVDRNTNLLCFLQLSYIIGWYCKWVLGCKFIMCIRTNPMAFYKNVSSIKIPLPVYKRLLHRADGIIANSETTARQLRQVFHLKNVDTIANGYDISRILKLSATRNPQFEALFREKKVLVHTGRLEYDKGQWHLLRILASVCREQPDVCLLILGTGSYLPRLQLLGERLGLKTQTVFDDDTVLLPDQQVYFCGFQQNPYQYYPQASLFLFPSIYEGLPNAPIEALICGLPCILSDCVSGPREILFPDSLDDKVSRTAEVSRYGVLLPAFNGSELFDTRELIPEETLWVQEICKALSNPQQLEEWKTASQEIRTKYDANRVIGLWKAHCR